MQPTSPPLDAAACSAPSNESAVLERADFPQLIQVLREHGFRVLGPTVRDGAIIYDELTSEADLPIGWGDEQDAGRYRLKRRADAALFGYAVGPHSWKKFLFPPALRLWSADRTQASFAVRAETPEVPHFAFVGVRACELHAIAVQDRVFMGKFVDPTYAARRRQAFIVAVNCGAPAGTCFCDSMNTGPKADAGFDLALTEILAPGSHRFLLEVGSAAGRAILEELPSRPAAADDLRAAAEVIANTRAHMGRSMETCGLKELLYANYEHPRWNEVADRCLTCANCTMACPTCFCSSIDDVTDLTGDHAERWRRWESCFTMDFSHLAGGSVRATPRSCYRQWITHKLATWHDQFGTSGCVGCGRCITWCPVGIDITEEARVIRQTSTSKPETTPLT